MGQIERGARKEPLPYVKQIASGNLLTQKLSLVSVTTQRGGMGGRWQEGSRGRGHMYTCG